MGEDVNLFRYVGNDPGNFVDPLGLTKSDPWYGYNNRDFQRWFHLCWKKKGGPRVTPRDEIAEAYAEWLSRGEPKDGKCWGKPKECDDKRSFGEKLKDAWNNFDEWMQGHYPQPKPNPVPGLPPKPWPVPVPIIP